ncbi:hypothetical protein V5O48_005228 [Marasmius crinis-equi]|uniref:F-box domain-containing protein n=1 Tax=Marasmius crinis-equi TaxID=585013 RepID=A0ABR3FMY5_9AGAR
MSPPAHSPAPVSCSRPSVSSSHPSVCCSRPGVSSPSLDLVCVSSCSGMSKARRKFATAPAGNPFARCPNEIWDQIFRQVAVSGGNLHSVILTSTRFYHLAISLQYSTTTWVGNEVFEKNALFFDRIFLDAIKGEKCRFTVDIDICLRITSLTLGSLTLPYPPNNTNPFAIPRMHELVSHFDNLTHFAVWKVVFPLHDLFFWLGCLSKLESVSLVDVSTVVYDWRRSSLNAARHAPYCRNIRKVEIQGFYSAHWQFNTLMPVLLLLTLRSVEQWKVDWTVFRAFWLAIKRNVVEDPSGMGLLCFTIPHHRDADFPPYFQLPPDLSSLELIVARSSSWLNVSVAEPDSAGLFVMEMLSCTSSLRSFSVDGWVSARCWSGGRIASASLEKLAVPLHLTYILLPPIAPNLKTLSLLPVVYQDLDVTLDIVRDVVRLPGVQEFQAAVVNATPALLSSVAKTFSSLRKLIVFVSGGQLPTEEMLAIGSEFFRSCRGMEEFQLYTPRIASGAKYSKEDMETFVHDWGSIARNLREVRLSIDSCYFHALGSGMSFYSGVIYSRTDIYVPDEIVEQIVYEVVSSGGSLYGAILADTRLYRLALDYHLRDLVWSDPVLFSGSALFFVRARAMTPTGKNGRLTVTSDVFLKPQHLTIGSRAAAYPGAPVSFPYSRMFEISASFLNLRRLCIAKVGFPLDELFAWLRALPNVHTVALVDVCTVSHDWLVLSTNVAKHAPYCRSVRNVEVQGFHTLSPFHRSLITVMVLVTLPNVESWKFDWVGFRCVWEYIVSREIAQTSGNLANSSPPPLRFLVRGHPFVPDFPSTLRLPPKLSSFELVTSRRMLTNDPTLDESNIAGLHALEFLMRGSVRASNLEQIQAPMNFTRLILSPQCSKLTVLRLVPQVYDEVDFMATNNITTDLVSVVARTFPNLKDLILYAENAVLGESDMVALGKHFLCKQKRLEVIHLYAPAKPALWNYSAIESMLFIDGWESHAPALREVRLSVHLYQVKVLGNGWVTIQKDGSGWEVYGY